MGFKFSSLLCCVPASIDNSSSCGISIDLQSAHGHRNAMRQLKKEMSSREVSFVVNDDLAVLDGGHNQIAVQHHPESEQIL